MFINKILIQLYFLKVKFKDTDDSDIKFVINELEKIINEELTKDEVKLKENTKYLEQIKNLK